MKFLRARAPEDPSTNIRKDALQIGFDVILTSGGCIDDPHGMFRRNYGDNLIEELLKRLIDEGVEGDFIWMPLTKRGPFNLANFHARLQEEHPSRRPRTKGCLPNEDRDEVDAPSPPGPSG